MSLWDTEESENIENIQPVEEMPVVCIITGNQFYFKNFIQ